METKEPLTSRRVKVANSIRKVPTSTPQVQLASSMLMLENLAEHKAVALTVTVYPPTTLVNHHQVVAYTEDPKITEAVAISSETSKII